MAFEPLEDPEWQCGPSVGKCPNGQCCNMKGECGECTKYIPKTSPSILICHLSSGTGTGFCDPENCLYGYGPCQARTVNSAAVCGATSSSQASCSTGCCSAEGKCGTGASFCTEEDPDLPAVNGVPKGCQQAFSKDVCVRFVNVTHGRWFI